MQEAIKVISVGIFLLVEGIRDIKQRQISMISVGIFAIIGLILQLVFDFDGWYKPIGGATLGILLLLFAKITKEKIGYGDGWIIFVTGIYLGFRYNVFLLTMALFLAALVSVGLLICKKVNRQSAMPFVTFVFVGYCIMLTGLI